MMVFEKIDISDLNALKNYLQKHTLDRDFHWVCQKTVFACVNNNAADALQVVIEMSSPSILTNDHLERAASKGHDAVLAVLLPHYDLNTPLGNNVLAAAAKAGHLECLKLCNERVTDTDYWYNALAQVCMYGHEDCVPFLLNKSDASAYNSRILNLSIQYKNDGIAQLLIDSGQVNGQDAYNDAKVGHFSNNLPKLEELMAPVWLRQRLQQRLSEETAHSDTIVGAGRKM